jgi:hypothetical protein
MNRRNRLRLLVVGLLVAMSAAAAAVPPGLVLAGIRATGVD